MMAGSALQQKMIDEFGHQLRVARVRAGKMQQEVADYLGIHRSAVSQLERGDRADLPPDKTVLKLDKYLKANGELAKAAGIKINGTGSGKTEKFIPIPEGVNLTPADVRKVKEYIDLLANQAKR